MDSVQIRVLREKLKNVLRGYRRMTKSIKKELSDLGFIVKIGKTHHKVYHVSNLDKFYTISATASDNRAGLNIALTLSSGLPIHN